MIPDKIYIAAQTFPNEIDWDGSPINTKKVEDTDVQYIRKDAILDILNARLKKIDLILNKRHDPLFSGQRYLLVDLIEKLESL